MTGRGNDNVTGWRFSRREALALGGIAGLSAAAASVYRTKKMRASVFVAANQSYDGPLAKTIEDGLITTGLKPADVRNRRVLLKPNLVEPMRSSPQMTTNPAVVLAAADVFRKWGAHVAVGEGPGHVRDTELALVESNLDEPLRHEKIEFRDLNYEQVQWVANRGKASKLAGFFFPRSVVEADFIVSMPKMKTHHWVGFTGALKNLYGIIPGIKYGWPKNVLHHAGIPETVFDINASAPRALAIVDGILAMEGDGPIMGSPVEMGLLLIGTNSTAVDATLGRIMGLAPERVSYMQLAADQLGPVHDSHIEQRGERWHSVQRPFRLLDAPHLKSLRSSGGELISSVSQTARHTV